MGILEVCGAETHDQSLMESELDAVEPQSRSANLLGLASLVFGSSFACCRSIYEKGKLLLNEWHLTYI